MLRGANREGVQGARQSNTGMRLERRGMEAGLGRDPKERAQEQRAERGLSEEGERKRYRERHKETGEGQAEGARDTER